MKVTVCKNYYPTAQIEFCFAKKWVLILKNFFDSGKTFFGSVLLNIQVGGLWHFHSPPYCDNLTFIWRMNANVIV